MHVNKNDIVPRLDINFSESEIISVDGYNIVCFSNLSLVSKTLDRRKDNIKKIIPGNSFPLFFSDKYFHMIIDRVCIFEYLQSVIPNLNAEFIVSGFPISHEIEKEILNENVDSFIKFIKNKFFNHNAFIDDPVDNYNYFQDIYSIYSENKRISYIQNINLELEKCFIFIEKDSYLLNLFNEDKNLFIEYIFGDGTRVWLQSDRDRNWESKGIALLQDRLSKIYGSFEPLNDIYVSRKGYTQKYKENKDLASPTNRIYENEDVVEKIFNDYGFISTTLEGMSLKDQFITFNSSKSVAGYNGSNLLNIILSKNKLKVYEVSSKIKNYFEYSYFSNKLGHDHISLKEENLIEKGTL